MEKYNKIMNYQGDYYEREQAYYRDPRPQVYNNYSESSDSSSSDDSQECVVLQDEEIKVQKQVSLLPLDDPGNYGRSQERIYENANEKIIVEKSVPEYSSSEYSSEEYERSPKHSPIVEERVIIAPGEVFVEERLDSSSDSSGIRGNVYVPQDNMVSPVYPVSSNQYREPGYQGLPVYSGYSPQPNEVIIVEEPHKNHYRREDIIITSPSGVIVEEKVIPEHHKNHNQKKEEDILIVGPQGVVEEVIIEKKHHKHQTVEEVVIIEPNGAIVEEVIEKDPKSHHKHKHHGESKKNDEVMVKNTLTEIIRAESIHKKKKRSSEGSGACRNCEIF
jgi:hypothetical protein